MAWPPHYAVFFDFNTQLTKDILAHIDACNAPFPLRGVDGKVVSSLPLKRPDAFGTTFSGIALLMRLRNHWWPDLRTWWVLRNLVKIGVIVRYSYGGHRDAAIDLYARPMQYFSDIG